jgi:hypothetical protein
VAADEAAARRAYLGSFAEALARRLQDLPGAAVTVLLFNWPLAFGAFCLGLVAGRRGLLDDPARLAGVLPPVRWLVAGALVGNLAAAAAYRLPGGWVVAAYALLALGAPCLAALYALALARAWGIPRARAWMEAWLVPGGRMSLSNYLGQSVAANLLWPAGASAFTARWGPRRCWRWRWRSPGRGSRSRPSGSGGSAPGRRSGCCARGRGEAGGGWTLRAARAMVRPIAEEENRCPHAKARFPAPPASSTAAASAICSPGWWPFLPPRRRPGAKPSWNATCATPSGLGWSAWASP